MTGSNRELRQSKTSFCIYQTGKNVGMPQIPTQTVSLSEHSTDPIGSPSRQLMTILKNIIGTQSMVSFGLNIVAIWNENFWMLTEASSCIY